MRGMCSETRLSDRYFYESFRDRDDLLVKVAEQTRDEALLRLAAAIEPELANSPYAQLRAAIEEIVRLITEEPCSAHILFGEHSGSGVLERARREAIRLAVELMIEIARPHLAEGARDEEFRLNVLVGIGGFVETVAAWRSGIIDVTAKELVEMLQKVGESLALRFLAVEER
jgi:AcrR family transcriptional regulator